MSIEEEIKALKRIASFHSSDAPASEMGNFYFFFITAGTSYLADDYRYAKNFSIYPQMIGRGNLDSITFEPKMGNVPADPSWSRTLWKVPVEHLSAVKYLATEVSPIYVDHLNKHGNMIYEDFLRLTRLSK